MAEPWQYKLGAFEAELRVGTCLRWPAETLAPRDVVELVRGDGDVLLLSHSPSRHFGGREPVHQSLMLELPRPLARAAVGAQALGRVVYRAGAERLLYQTTSIAGTVILLEAGPDSYELSLDLTLVAPELDATGGSSRQLSGVVRVARPRGAASQ